MAYNITPEDIKKIKEIEGEVRGVVFKTDEHFILRKDKEEGIKKVKEELKNMEEEIDYTDIDRMAFYPLSLRIFSLLAISRAFDLDKEGVFEMGKRAPRVSFLIKFFTKYFMSVEKTLGKVTELWQKHYSVGKIEDVRVSEKEGVAVFRLYEANFHPIFCNYLLGYFSSVVSMVVGKEVRAEETKCSFKEDDYHEFHLTWDPNEEN